MSELSELPRTIRSLCMQYLDIESLLIMQKFHRGRFMIRGFWRDIDKIILDGISCNLYAFFGDDTIRFLTILYETKSRMVGSFLLHCLNPEIPFDDVDVQLSVPISGQLHPLEIFFIELWSQDATEEGLRSHGYTEMRQNRSEVIQSVKYFMHPTLMIKFQLVFTKFEPPRYNFPGGFSCTRNSFDGKELSIFDLTSITRRQINIDVPENFHSLEASAILSFYHRWAKYLDKGFKPIIHKSTILTLRSHFSREEDRTVRHIVDHLCEKKYAVRVQANALNRGEEYLVMQTHRLGIVQNQQIEFI